jgi:hypothetical protein
MPIIVSLSKVVERCDELDVAIWLSYLLLLSLSPPVTTLGLVVETWRRGPKVS